MVARASSIRRALRFGLGGGLGLGAGLLGRRLMDGMSRQAG